MRSEMFTIALCILAAPEYVTARPTSRAISQRGVASSEGVAHSMERRNQPAEIQKMSHGVVDAGEVKQAAAGKEAAASEKKKKMQKTATSEMMKQEAAAGGEAAAGAGEKAAAESTFSPSPLIIPHNPNPAR